MKYNVESGLKFINLDKTTVRLVIYFDGSFAASKTD